MRLLVLAFALFGAACAFSVFGDPEHSELQEASDCKCVNGRCVVDKRGRKKCACFPKHSPTNEETCLPCDCGSKGKCIFVLERKSWGMDYTKKCVCDKGSAEKDGLCVDCQCGPNSKCEFEGEEKVCYCEDGFSEKFGVCTACDCGEYGDCRFEGAQKVCSCFPGYYLDPTTGRCEDPCSPNPCLNNGECSADANARAVCKCPKNYWGDICEINPCTRNPCKNNGQCSFDFTGKTACQCPFPFVGANCEVDPCSNYQCKNNGKCTYTQNRNAQCQCPDAFAGQFCEKISCRDNSDCSNGGSCGQDRVCVCPEGTAGDHCEIVPGCKELDDACRRTNAHCGFDPSARNKATCLCREAGKAYDSGSQTCKRTCKSNDDCANGGTCNQNNFCVCPEGTTGDRCEVVPGCNGLQAACAKANAACVYDRFAQNKAFCLCRENGKKFDAVTQTCKEPCIGNQGCRNGGSCNGGFCRCPEGTEGDHCEVVSGCRELKRICDWTNADCVYDPTSGDKATCKCKDPNKKFDVKTKSCKGTCDGKQCGNGGVCVEGFCFCPNGLAGDFCEEVVGCREGLGDVCERTNADCVFDDSAPNKARCECRGKGRKFDPVTKTCKKVECVEKRCQNGRCEIVAGEQEVCRCFEGFGLEGDYCRKLNCSMLPCVNGECIVRANGKEECICASGYTYYQGRCQRGNCRIDTCFGGRCATVEGELLCICPKGYRHEGIGCFATVCKRTNCFGGVCVVKEETDEEICTCPEHHVLVNDVCKRILCEKKACFGGQCNIVDGREVCTCPAGYTLHDDVCRAH